MHDRVVHATQGHCTHKSREIKQHIQLQDVNPIKLKQDKQPASCSELQAVADR